MAFGLFFLGEYANMMLMSAMTTILFLGGWLSPIPFEPFTWIPGPIWFIVKVCLCLFGILWVRATFPRFRYDQLMRLGLEVVPAAVAVLAGVDGRRAGRLRLASESGPLGKAPPWHSSIAPPAASCWLSWFPA